MKQLLQNMKDGEAVVVDLPVPDTSPGMALVRTAASLVSAGTERMVVEFAEKGLIGKARSRPDLVKQVLDKARREGILSTVEAALNRLDQPMALGYSSAGTVTALGAGMEGFQAGQRVACAGGGYAVHAEYALVPKNLLTPLPDSVDFESAAFTTIGAIALQGFRLAEVQLGERVAVIGLGLLGLLSVQLCHAAGCSVFGVDLDPQRIEMAQKMGAAAAGRDAAEAAAAEFTRGEGFDAVLICADTTSNDPVWLAGQIARDRAKVVAVGAVGLTIPRKIYYQKELSLVVSRSYGPGRYDPAYEEGGVDYPISYVRWTEGRNMAGFVDLLAKGRIDVREMITHRFPIADAPQAYQLITGKREEPFLGVLLTYPQHEVQAVVRRVTLPQPSTAKAAGALSLGVLGAGNYAQAVFLPMVKKTGDVQLHTIVSGAGMTAATAGKRFGFRYASASEVDILENENINLVAILSRHQHHARQTEKALRQGQHIYCEKPLAIREEELAALAAILKRETSAMLCVGFNRRFAPLAITMKHALRGSEPMVVHYRINAGMLPANHWLHDPNQGGGRIIGEGCHFIDFINFLVGDIPATVRADALPDDERYHLDNVILTLRYANGSIGTVAYLANGDKAFPKEAVEVFQNGTAARLDDFRTLELCRNGNRKVIHNRLRQDKGHASAWQTFLRAVRIGGEAPIPYRHILGSTQAAFAAMESLRTGGDVPVVDRWTEIPETLSE
ncbi:MAG: Gfo/Idh/MocA family oxidoreductase [Anaerolineae bacterium]|nr:Gfo/Idh/MocA family oxidoreductase [Anaerolineae bacterium]